MYRNRNPLTWFLWALIAAGVALVLWYFLGPGLATPAAAQEAAAAPRGPAHVSLAVLRPLLDQLVLAVAGFVAVWATALFHRFTGVAVEKNRRDALQTALANGIGVLVNRLPAGGLSHLSAGSPELNAAVQYVIDAVPDTVAYFKLGPQDIADKLLAKAGVMNVALPTTPVTPGA